MYTKKIKEYLETTFQNQKVMALYDYDKKEVVEEIEMQLLPIIEYVGVVAHQTAMSPIWGAVSENIQAYQARIMAADNLRRVKHEAAVCGVRVLNRLMKRNGLAPFYAFSEDAELDMAVARREVRLCCAQLTCELLSLAWPDILSFDGLVLYLADHKISLDNSRSEELVKEAIGS